MKILCDQVYRRSEIGYNLKTQILNSFKIRKGPTRTTVITLQKPSSGISFLRKDNFESFDLRLNKFQ